jgi:hypothetical protein
MFPPDHTIRRELASRTTTPATVTNHLVRCSRSVIIPPYVVFRASLLGRRTYLNARYSRKMEACRSYQGFLVWLMVGVGLGQEDAIHTFLGVDYPEVAKLLAAGAKRIDQLNKYLELTNVERVNLSSVSFTLQSLKPSCRWKLRVTLPRAGIVPTAAFVVR